MPPFFIHFRHSSDSILNLCKVQHRIFNRKWILLGYTVCSAALIVSVGFAESGNPLAIVIILAACWGIMAINQTPERTAKKIIEQFPNHFPAIDYVIDKKQITARFEHSQTSILYDEIYRLIEDNTYCYIALLSKSLYIFEKNEAKDLEQVKAAIAKYALMNWVSKSNISSPLFYLIKKSK